MILTRRRLLQVGGGWFVSLPLGPRAGQGGEPVHIVMTGDGAGARVWFDPVGLLVRPGQTIRWTNRDRGNVHTATAYHPDNDGRPHRIPRAATAWDSGFLMPGDSFSVTLTEPGVYDYFCIPHEMAGMAGRVLVRGKDVGEMPFREGEEAAIPAAVLDVLPAVDEILEAGMVRHRECGRKDRCS